MDERIRFGTPIEFPVPFEALPPASLISPGNVHRNEPFQVYILESVYSQIWQQVQASPQMECGGILVGYPFKTFDQSTTFVIVAGAIPQSSSNRGIAHFTVGPEEVAATRILLDQTFPGLMTVGWYHSHPGHGVFLSEQDMVIVRSLYNQPWHLALVVDPKRREVAFFLGPEGLQLPGWNVLSRLPESIRVMALYNQAKAWRQANDVRQAEQLTKQIGILVNAQPELLHWKQQGGYRDLGNQGGVVTHPPSPNRFQQPAARPEKGTNILAPLFFIFLIGLLFWIIELLVATNFIISPLPVSVLGLGLLLNLLASYTVNLVVEQSSETIPSVAANGRRQAPDYRPWGVVITVSLWLIWVIFGAVLFLTSYNWI